MYRLIGAVIAFLFLTFGAAAQTFPSPTVVNINILGAFTANGGTVAGVTTVAKTLTTEPTSNYSLLHSDLTYQGDGAGTGAAVGGFETTLTLTGTIKDNMYHSSSYLIDKALCPASGACGATVSAQGSVQRMLPAGGVPLGSTMLSSWSFWAPQTDTTDLPTSIAGAMLNEFDISTNNLDDATNRSMLSAVLSQQSGSAHATEAQGFSLTSNAPTTAWYESGLTLNGPYNLAGIDFRTATTKRATITSATPPGNVDSITVDNVMPFVRGGNSYDGTGQWLGTASTKATTGIIVASTTSGSPNITVSAACGSDSTCIQIGEYVTDVTNLSAIPVRTKVQAGAGTSWTLSATVNVTSGDQLIFSHGERLVTVADGTRQTVVGVALSGTGTTAGTLYFNGALTSAQAANGTLIAPVAPTIWLNEGDTTTPPGIVAFDRAATATIGSDSAGGVAITGNGLTVGKLISTGFNGNTGIQGSLAGNIYGNADTRANSMNTTLALNSGNTNNIWENDFGSVVLSGSGTQNGEINVNHSYFEYDGTGSITTSVEDFEASALNNGNMANGEFQDFLGLFHNGAAGTISHAIGFDAQLTNDNTTANSVAIWEAFSCNPMIGSGSQPEFGYCLNNGDSHQVVATAGHVDFIPSTAPTLSGCGTTPSLDANATDTAGTITEGTSATGCTLTFNKTFTNGGAPHCVISSPNGAPFTGYSTTASTLAITNSSATGNKYTYICFGIF